jgi:Ca-activated chloride channel family protein
MKIGNPHFLTLLLALPGLAVVVVYGLVRRRAELRRFVSETMIPRVVIGLSSARLNLKAGLLLVGTLFLVLCLLGPQWGFHWEDVKRSGVDIIIALDTSESMLSQDVKPSRLERAKHEVYDLINMLQGDRVGLVVFSGGAFVQCPLTLDYGACLMFLDYIDTTVVPQKGTNLAEAIETAAAAFEDGKGRSKAIILISDGGNLQGDPVQAARRARSKGIKIYAVGIGRQDEEAPIPLPGGGLKYKDGKMVTTKLDDHVLQEVALATGGTYVRSVTGDLDLERIYYEEVHKKLQRQELQSTRRKRWEERFQWPLTVAIMLLLIEPLIGERRKNAAT